MNEKMSVNYLDMLLIKKEKYVIVEVTILCRKGIETNSKKVVGKCKQNRAKVVSRF